MKDFENDLIYYHNPDPIEEPIGKISKIQCYLQWNRVSGIPYRFV